MAIFNSEHPFVYLDHAATTRPGKEVVEAMLRYLREEYGNASTIYRFGQRSRAALEESRAVLAKLLGVSSREIYFTSGGTEADNWAIIAAAEMHPGGHIITTRIEHPAVLQSCAYLESRGYRVSYLPVDAFGRVAPREVEEAIQEDSFLISVMTANNEVGTIEPIREIGEIAGRHHILLHTDCVQGFSRVEMSEILPYADLLSASAHKISGPKGVGMLYIRKGVKLPGFLHGGEQERGKRAGTENVAGIVGFAKAAELTFRTQKERDRRVRQLRDLLEQELKRRIPGLRVHGDMEHRLPGICHISLPHIEGETMLLMLDQYGIYCSAGSACASGSLEPSHVLLAMGCSREEAYDTLRFSLGEENTEEEVLYVSETVEKLVRKLQR